MIDLHTHSLLSDGDLLPSELIRRAEMKGYKAIAVTDHVDFSNLDFVLPRIIKACKAANKPGMIRALPGVELTHIAPLDIAPLAHEARKMGATIIIVHGETITEPVEPDTNIYALQADIDILAHPGLITDDQVCQAAHAGICLEISARKGHSLCNGHVALLSKKHGARLVLNTDAHNPEDLIPKDQACKIALGAGLDKKDCDMLFENSRKLIEVALKRLVY